MFQLFFFSGGGAKNVIIGQSEPSFRDPTRFSKRQRHTQGLLTNMFFLCWENTTNNNVSFFLLDVSSVRFPPSFAAPNALREIYVDVSSFFSCDVSLRRQQFRLLISSLFFCPAFHGSPWRIPGWEHFSQGTRATPHNRRQVHQVMKDGAEGNTGFFSRAFALFRV